MQGSLYKRLSPVLLMVNRNFIAKQKIVNYKVLPSKFRRKIA